MWVLSSFLKILKSETCLISSGKLFQTHGAVNVKALSPYVFNFVEGTTASLEFDDLSFLIGSYSFVKSEIYRGLVPFKALKQIVAILYSILALIGSQCNCSRSGVTWLLLLTLNISLAALFWTLCNLLMFSLEETHKRELQ